MVREVANATHSAHLGTGTPGTLGTGILGTLGTPGTLGTLDGTPTESWLQDRHEDRECQPR